MPDENGSRDTRLDRIERALELLISDHELFREEQKSLLRAQVLQQDQIEKTWAAIQAHTQQIELLRQKDEALDGRVDRLVSAIGELVRRGPTA